LVLVAGRRGEDARLLCTVEREVEREGVVR